MSEFMKPLGLEAETLANAIGVPVDDLIAMIEGQQPVSGELDLRLTRYFRMSKGFFLRLQNQCDLMEAKRALNGELDRIVPRAA